MAPGKRPALGPRLLLGAAAGFVAAVPLTGLALAVRAGPSVVTRADQSLAQSAHDWAAGHPAVISLAHLVETAFAPWTFRVLVALLVVYLWWRGARRLAWWAAVTMTTAGLLGFVLKLIVARARPVLDDPLGTAGGYSFPSGHALNSFAGVAVILLALLPSLRRPASRAAAWLAGVAVVAITGIDRVVLGVHYGSDVLAGWIAGLSVVLATSAAFETWRLERGRAPTGPLEGVEPETATVLRHPLRRAVTQRWTRFAAAAIAWCAILVACGLTLAHLRGFQRSEDGVDRALAAGRTPGWTSVSAVLSGLASTPGIIATGLVAGALLWLVLRRWRDPLTLAIAVVGQLAIFLLTATVVDRTRPDVPKLDEAPPTSSFPSGHTGAATALYVTLGIVLARRLRPGWPRVSLIGVFALIPVGVALARLYRGMHHPTDVTFGLLNGLVFTTLAVRLVSVSARDTPKAKRPNR